MQAANSNERSRIFHFAPSLMAIGNSIDTIAQNIAYSLTRRGKSNVCRMKKDVNFRHFLTTCEMRCKFEKIFKVAYVSFRTCIIRRRVMPSCWWFFLFTKPKQIADRFDRTRNYVKLVAVATKRRKRAAKTICMGMYLCSMQMR